MNYNFFCNQFLLLVLQISSKSCIFLREKGTHWKDFNRMKPNNENKELLSVYRFDDFRAFIGAKYAEAVDAKPGLSCRAFAAAAGFSNPGFINDVIKGRRRLSREALQKLIAVFRFAGNEADYFKLLVSYGQEKDCARKAELYKKLIVRRNRSSFARVDPALTRYYQDYRYPLIRTAIMSCRFSGDCERLSRFIYPSLPPELIHKYVADLESWGIISRADDGIYSVTERFLEPPGTMKDIVRQLQREWIEHAADALVRIPSDKRNMSSMLLALSPKVCKTINEKIEALRGEIWDLVRNDTETPSSIMQLNIQYFPRSRTKER